MGKDYVEAGGGGGRGLTIKTSRIYYYNNYILAALMLFLASMVYVNFNLTLTFTPRTLSEFMNTMIVFAFVAVITYLVEEATIEKMMRKYVITNDEVAKIEGVLRKNRISIPYANISDVRVRKGVAGRLFNFGDVYVTGFKDEIKIKGAKNPEMVSRIIGAKMSASRAGGGRGEGGMEVKLGKKGKGRKRKNKEAEEIEIAG